MTVAAAAAVGIAAYGAFKRRGASSVAEGEGDGKSLPWRKNVLAALLLAYASLLVVFVVMLWAGAEPKDAFDAINVPFVALVGGTLAIVKDLV